MVLETASSKGFWLHYDMAEGQVSMRGGERERRLNLQQIGSLRLLTHVHDNDLITSKNVSLFNVPVTIKFKH
jgi:hypothetical protein